MCDGILSDNLPSLRRATLTVSPFSGNSSICPEEARGLTLGLRLPQGPANSTHSLHLSPANCLRLVRAVVPPSTAAMEQLCGQGFRDAARLLASRGLLRCQGCQGVSGGEGCRGCQERVRQVEAQGLPQEVQEVFRRKGEVQGGVRRWVEQWATPLLLQMATYALRKVKVFRRPSIEVCPFGPSSQLASLHRRSLSLSTNFS